MCIIKSYNIGLKLCFFLYFFDFNDLSLGQNGVMFLEQLLGYERVFLRGIEIEKYELKLVFVKLIQQLGEGVF